MFVAAIPHDLHKDACARVLVPASWDQHFNGCFNRKKVSISYCNQETAVDAFRKRLIPDSELYEELTKFNCNTIEDVLARVWVEIRWEEDEVYKAKQNSTTDRHHRQVERRKEWHSAELYQVKRGPTRGNRYPNDHHTARHSERALDQPQRYKMPDYNLNIEPTEVVAMMKEMGKVVLWLAKLKHTGTKRDTTKWCEFHEDHRHVTAKCIALCLEVMELLKRGHLRDFLIEKGKNTIANKDRQITPPPKAPPTDGMCNMISGGSEVNGVTYSRRNATLDP
ncbi:uncharacterized protein LOC116129317 [Pistacia vera]|uniref:uncharacterized protein LOC116129317 n=1 Tax=Pistacia vera TaxID=55513 RepID=UPI0012632DE6|nr:uncharacterized protein LOC116129317 [Pistacia vera]